MSCMKNFDSDFVKRTIEVLDKCYETTEYEVTLLLNCLLALVSLPIERNKVTKKEVQEEKMQNFQNDCVIKLEELRNKKDYINKNKLYFFNNIRNAIAHLHIKVEEGCYKNKIENVILRNYENDEKLKKDECNLQISISVKNLKKFAIYVAEEYLRVFFEEEI